MRFALSILAVALLMLGCSSVRTVPLTRLTDNSLIADEDSPLKGLPVMLKIPTHVELTAYEIEYYYYEPGAAEVLQVTNSTGAVTTPHADAIPEGFNPIPTPCGPVRDFTYVVKQTDKMFVVDPLRPAAGQGGFGFTFGGAAGSGFSDANGGSSAGHGYVSGFNYKAVDQTILQTSALLTNSLNILRGKTPTAPALTAGGSTGNAFDNVVTVKRAIAFRRFDINDPCFEANVDEFLTEFVNPAPPIRKPN